MLNKITPEKFCKALIISQIITLLLLLVVLWKSQYYKKWLIKMDLMEEYASDKDRPDYWAINGWTNTLQKMHYDADIAFFGNSITCMSDFQKYFPTQEIVELGYPGDSMEGMMRRMDQLRAVTPEKVFLMAGINGLLNMPLDKFEKQYNTLLDSIHVATPKSKVYVQSILPVNNGMRENMPDSQKIKEGNAIIKKICDERKMTYINLYRLYANKNGEMQQSCTIDGLHLKPEAYKRWADEIKKYIDE